MAVLRRDKEAWAEYEARLAEGRAPFGEPFNANITEAIDGYSTVIRKQRSEVERLREALRIAGDALASDTGQHEAIDVVQEALDA